MISVTFSSKILAESINNQIFGAAELYKSFKRLGS